MATRAHRRTRARRLARRVVLGAGGPAARRGRRAVGRGRSPVGVVAGRDRCTTTPRACATRSTRSPATPCSSATPTAARCHRSRACTRRSRTSCISPRSRSRWGSRPATNDADRRRGGNALDAAIRVRRRRAHARSPSSRSRRFFHDCDARDRPAPRSIGCDRSRCTRCGTRSRVAAWREKPATYVVCTDDRALPVALQRSNAARIGNSIDWPTSHSPFLSRPELVADLLIELSSR